MSMLLHITAVAQCNFNEEWICKVKVIKSVSFESLDRQKKNTVIPLFYPMEIGSASASALKHSKLCMASFIGGSSLFGKTLFISFSHFSNWKYFERDS